MEQLGFFGAIRQMPRLQLYGVVLPPCINLTISTPAADDIIELPLLPILMLRGIAHEATNIHLHLQILPCCSVEIECTTSESSQVDNTGLISSLRNLYFAPPSSDNLVSFDGNPSI